MATHNCEIPSSSGAHPLGYTPCIHKPPPITPILHHFLCFSGIQTSLSSTVLHDINPSLPWLTHRATTSTLFYLSSFPPHSRTTGEHLHQSFRLPHLSLRTTLIRGLGTLFIILIPSKPLRLSIYTALILDLSSFHNIVSLQYIITGTSNVSCKDSKLKLQIPSIN